MKIDTYKVHHFLFISELDYPVAWVKLKKLF